jgi:hypothetical protein
MKTWTCLRRIFLSVMLVMMQLPLNWLPVAAGPSNLIVTLNKFDTALDYTLDYLWSLDKTVNPTQVDLFLGGQTEVVYTLVATRTQQSTFTLTFEVSIENRHASETAIFDAHAVIAQPSGSPVYASSALFGGLALAPGETWSAVITVPFSLVGYNAPDLSPLKISLVFHNLSASFKVHGDTSAAITFKSVPSQIIDDQITLSDDQSTLSPWTLSGSTTLTYSKWISAGSSLGTHSVVNTAQATTSEGVISASATVVVNTLNRAPKALNDSYTLDEDTLLSVSAPGLLANDLDADGHGLSVAEVVSPLHGVAVVQPDGSFTYTPTLNYHGSDSFSYRITDGHALSEPALVSLNILPINDAPIGLNDHYTIPEDTLLVVHAPGVLSNDSDVDGDTLSAHLVGEPLYGTLDLSSDGSFSYMPDADFVGEDGFVYRVSDGSLYSAWVFVTITVSPVNDAPIALNDHYSLIQGSSLTISAPGILSNDVDAEGDVLTALLFDDVEHGLLVLNGDGSFTYTPTPSLIGTDAFTYRVSDGEHLSNLATVSFTITKLNHAPLASPLSLSVAQGQSVSGQLVAVDVDGDALVYTLSAPALQGSAVVGSTGLYSYTHLGGSIVNDGFMFSVEDPDGLISTATVSITIVMPTPPPPPPAVNLAPSVSPLSLTVARAGTVLGQVVANDPEGAWLSYALISAPTSGSASVDPEGRVTYTHLGNTATSDAFTLQVSDGELSANATVTVRIVQPTPILLTNRAPILQSMRYSTRINRPLSVDVSPLAIDPDGDALSFILISPSSQGVSTLNASGQLTYIPELDYVGLDALVIQVSDGQASSNLATITIEVLALEEVILEEETTPLAALAQMSWAWLALLPLLWLLWWLRPNLRYRVINRQGKARVHYRRVRKPDGHALELNLRETKLDNACALELVIYHRFAKKLENVALRILYNGHYVDSTTVPLNLQSDFQHSIDLEA